jgi:N-acetylneuraminic acid mutarotase
MEARNAVKGPAMSLLSHMRAAVLVVGLASTMSAAEHLSWEKGADGAGQHFAHSAVWDSEDHGFLVFGGESILGAGKYSICHDLWLYSPSSKAWKTIATPTAPEARAYHASSWDSQRSTMWLFGGMGADLAARQDLWRYDAKSQQWSAITCTGPAPSARFSPSLHYSARLDRLILYGGSKGFQMNCALDDVWSFNPATLTWTQLDSKGPGLWQCASALDDSNGNLLVQGGYDGACRATGKTWSCNLKSGAWSDLGDGPQSLIAGAAVWDEHDKRMIMYGGAHEAGDKGSSTAYSLVHGEWKPLLAEGAPGPRAYFSMARNPDDGSIFIVGGIANTFGSPMVSGTPWIWHP